MASLAILVSCHPDPCEVDHTIINGECIPDFIYPQNPNLKSGDRYYHIKYGVVTFENGLWCNNEQQPILELNLKNN